MGNIIQASCPCGYCSGNMMQGIGFSFRETGICYEPAYCDACGITEAVDDNEPVPACNSCNGPLIFYRPQTHTPLERTGLPGTNYLSEKQCWHCPDCKKETLRFNMIGSWD